MFRLGQSSGARQRDLLVVDLDYEIGLAVFQAAEILASSVVVHDPLPAGESMRVAQIDRVVSLVDVRRRIEQRGRILFSFRRRLTEPDRVGIHNAHEVGVLVSKATDGGSVFSCCRGLPGHPQDRVAR